MSGHALVVDDDVTMVKTLSDVLEYNGWTVSSAHTGTEAVEAATRRSFDVILMDIKMPGMDGVDAFKAIKSRQPDVKVILMTAYAAQDRIAEAEREGVSRILSKPVNIASLLDLLAATLKRSHSVLLVDHDAKFLRTLSDLMQLRGFDTVVATDVEHATRLMAEGRPLAVLLHIHLGSAPIREVVSAVHEKSPSAALILYSGRAGAEHELESVVPHEWVHGYLQKPFDVEAVMEVLDALRNRR